MTFVLVKIELCSLWCEKYHLISNWTNRAHGLWNVDYGWWCNTGHTTILFSEWHTDYNVTSKYAWKQAEQKERRREGRRKQAQLEAIKGFLVNFSYCMSVCSILKRCGPNCQSVPRINQKREMILINRHTHRSRTHTLIASEFSRFNSDDTCWELKKKKSTNHCLSMKAHQLLYIGPQYGKVYIPQCGRSSLRFLHLYLQYSTALSWKSTRKIINILR